VFLDPLLGDLWELFQGRGFSVFYRNLQLEVGGAKNAEFYKYLGVMITENENIKGIKNRTNQGRILTKQIVFCAMIKLSKTQR
jgi:hypothetical protein